MLRKQSIETAISLWSEWYGVQFSNEAFDDLVKSIMKLEETKNETRTKDLRPMHGAQTTKERPQGGLGARIQQTLVHLVEAGSRRIRDRLGEGARPQCGIRGRRHSQLRVDDRVERAATNGYAYTGNGSAVSPIFHASDKP